MELPKYILHAESSLTIFEFNSIGKKGTIKKIIKFSETSEKGIYNLGFGDKIPNTLDVDDTVITDNGDRDKVLATVVSAIYAFTDKHPDALVFATGSTPSRTRLYQIAVSSYYEELTADFEIYGLHKGQWMVFEKNMKVEALLAKRLLQGDDDE